VDVRELSFLLASAGLSTGLLDREMRSNRWDLKRLQKAINNRFAPEQSVASVKLLL
jgi:hypothetical protein